MIANDKDTYASIIALLRTRKTALVAEHNRIGLEHDRLGLEIAKHDAAIGLIVDLSGDDEAVAEFGETEPANGAAIAEELTRPETAGAVTVRAALEMIEHEGHPLTGGEIVTLLKERRHPALQRLPLGAERQRISSYLANAKDALVNIAGHGYWPVGKDFPDQPSP